MLVYVRFFLLNHLLFLVEEDVSILILLWFKLRVFLLSSKSILLYSFIVCLLNYLIIELKPFRVSLFTLLLYEWIIMASFRSSSMNYSSSQFIIVILVRLTLLSKIKLACILFNIDILRKFKLIIYFYFSHLIEIVWESF